MTQEKREVLLDIFLYFLNKKSVVKSNDSKIIVTNKKLDTILTVSLDESPINYDLSSFKEMSESKISIEERTWFESILFYLTTLDIDILVNSILKSISLEVAGNTNSEKETLTIFIKNNKIKISGLSKTGFYSLKETLNLLREV